MTPERWRQIEEIFQIALDLPEEERAAFIAGTCADDADLRVQVETLIRQDAEAGDFIEAPAFADSKIQLAIDLPETLPTTDIFEDPDVGRRIGAYRVVREIGRGGMGTVHLAERADSEFRKRVAIKLIKRGMDTDFILRRFRNERQILATLDHPNIARLLDGGTTEDHLPYFIMEYIEGMPVYNFCDERQLTIFERLRLFRHICAAVHYAHSKRVIHRDIKPSNILVTKDGVPKLLDFGIAKLVNPDSSVDITLDPTATAMRLMTPEYASPEQVHGFPATPTTDVYSLGVMLYELLTGHRPYRLRNRGPYEVARVICEEEPVHPSIVITHADDLLLTAPAISEHERLEYLYSNRGATADTLRRELAGDLDNVVMKALSKEPSRRYQTVEQLRDDITCYLEGRPVSAPPYFSNSAFAKTPGAVEASVNDKSLAVLPLKSFGFGNNADTAEDYLGIGLADALITRLSQLRKFAVRPTSSVLRYDRTGDPLTAGRELGTAFVLDGRIRRADERIRVTLQLLDVRSGAAVWAGQFDEKFTDVLSLEDVISAKVAEAIIPHLTGVERLQLAKRGTNNPEAHVAYMLGRYHWSTFTEEGFAKSLIDFHRAIALDPEYALAYAGIADYYNWVGVYAVMPFAETSAAAKDAALIAVALDETLAAGHSALGFATLTHEFDWTVAEQHLRRALHLDPNYATGHLWLSYHLIMTARFDEALSEIQRATELDPLSAINYYTLAWALYQARRFDESYDAGRKLIAMAPNYGLGHLFLGLLQQYTGAQTATSPKDGSLKDSKATELLGRTPYVLSWLAAGLAGAGKPEEARELLCEIEAATQTRYVSPYNLALVYANLGETERALAHLEQAFAIRDGWLTWLGVEPQFDSLRGHPKFRELLQRTNNPALLNASATAMTLIAGKPAQISPDAAAAREVQTLSSAQLPSSPQGTTGDAAPDSCADKAPLTDDDEANQLYVAACYYARRRTAEGVYQAIERLERAVERDPKFALAYAELADCYALLNWYVEPPPAEAWERAKQAALKAIEVNNKLAEPHNSLGLISLHYDRDWIKAEREFLHALELKPESSSTHRWYAYNLSAMNRHEEAIRQIELARKYLPRSSAIATAVANVLFNARRYDDAIAQCQKSLELDPGSVSTYTMLRWSYEKKGMVTEALAAFESERIFAGQTPTTRAKRAHVLAACGRLAEAREVLVEILAEREEKWVTSYEIAVIHALLGDSDDAFKWLAQAEREHAVGFTFIRVDPHLDALRSDPRFAELVRLTTTSTR
jgi:serine/threonine protein kinase/tetratricopeptide (TPR) repeat protein